mmetsp:Transcript_4361/g.5855  ORF Transcript_4361/g.5855 Transcript_4361/m.5855 type:complete len:1247 (-) Transcript_4361:827-4567(-)
MHTKFESKSNRVKGLSFHPSRPWILASLHNGALQLWDYRLRTLLDVFEEHDGPVRGIDFHHTQPLFVSGGDDYKIKVWNYKLRRCLFTLLGHLDYIRTVQFHHEYPWIVSASDDQTIRIWNWQSRSPISTMTGHNHYVMSAVFHPKDDLVVSASLDNTVRVWDTSGLRKKTVRGVPSEVSMGMEPGGNNAVMSRVNADLFGGTDAVVKYLLEGHDRGVNWASFHHSLPLIISGADDRQVKLWRMNETKAWEVDTMRGHTNNVSCVIFHPRRDLIVSNSEDRSIRVWDISRRVGVQTFRREHDRFWILAAHPEHNLLAAGHDSGMLVFNLERERPAYDFQTNSKELYYVKDERYLRKYEYATSEDCVQVSLRRSSSSMQSSSGLGNAPRSLVVNHLNSAEVNMLVCSDFDGGVYELVHLGKNSKGGDESHDSKRSQGLSACFIARNRFAVLDKSRQILIKNFKNDVTKRFTPPHPNTELLFSAGIAGRMLIKAEDKLTLFEVQSRRVVAEISAPHVKYVVWNGDCSYVALLCKHSVIICNRNLEMCCSISETVRVKSGSWDNNGVFIYSTLNHVKYCIKNGDHGILRTLDVPLYITRVSPNGDTIHCLDRECKIRTLTIDTTECLFKVALMKRQYGQVMKMIKNSKLCGQAIIAYLQEKGYPEVALHFVQDKKTRFKLALECGNLDVAMEAAVEVNEDECWNSLGIEALRHGNIPVVEMAYQRTKNFERLSFLYLMTGNKEKLAKMLKIAEMRKDPMSQFHNALYLGNVGERVKILEEVGQLALAYLTAASHGLTEDAERLSKALAEAEVPLPSLKDGAACLLPPIPLQRTCDNSWPLLEVSKGLVHDALAKGIDMVAEEELVDDPDEVKEALGSDADDFDDDDDFFGEDKDDLDLGEEKEELGGGGWGDDGDDLDFGADDADDAADEEVVDSSAGADVFVAPNAGVDPSTLWAQNSSLAADHAAAGAFESAMRLLNRQIGVVNYEPLKKTMRDIYLGTRCVIPGMPSVAPMSAVLLRDETNSLPSTCIKLQALVDRLRVAYAAFSGGRFSDSIQEFRSIMYGIPFLVVKKAEEREVKELLNICKEYVIGLMLEMKRKETKDPVRALELAVYFSHCKLQPSHLVLVLNIAMKAAYKQNNFITAASLAQRLLGMPESNLEANRSKRTVATKVLKKSEQSGRNEHQIDYDSSKHFNVGAFSMKPIYQAEKSVKCPFCGTHCLPEKENETCPVCGIAQLGVETLGLVVSS